ncbi:MAG: hypothetical protein ACREBR_04175, partial [bacterium]
RRNFINDHILTEREGCILSSEDIHIETQIAIQSALVDTTPEEIQRRRKAGLIETGVDIVCRRAKPRRD